MKVSNSRLSIGVPCDFPFIPASFFYSFTLMEKPDSYIFINDNNGNISDLRNNIVEKAQREGATKLLMFDTDQVYPVDTVTKLLAHNLPVVGATICRRYPPFDPIIMRMTDEGYKLIEDYNDGDLISVDATGTGCIMYDMQVFKTIPYPWFKTTKHPDTGMIVGEDFYFCQSLKSAGYDIMVDTSINVGHLATMVINKQTHNLYKAMKSAEARRSLTVDKVE